MNISALQKERANYLPKVPKSLTGAVKLVEGAKTESIGDQTEIAKLFPNTYGMPLISFEAGEVKKDRQPLNVGVILSGGQAPGGHNVIAGIFVCIKTLNAASKLYGFLGGPGGLVVHK
jgi:pyrophosphate--fructose-6-phosphate 1-phosphotransferase